MVRREEAIGKMGDFEAGLGSRPGWISPRRGAGCDYRISGQATPTPSADHIWRLVASVRALHPM
jgi:hypothetical protein